MKRLRITVDDRTYDVTVEVLSEDMPQLPAAAIPAPLAAASSAAPVSDAAAAKPATPAAAGAITSPMPGVVKSIEVKVGDNVTQGQTLLILDAMKMENKVSAPTAGPVKSIECATGDSVQEGQVLIVLGT
jgi:biotin carboxyl carrier protein